MKRIIFFCILILSLGNNKSFSQGSESDWQKFNSSGDEKPAEINMSAAANFMANEGAQFGAEVAVGRARSIARGIASIAPGDGAVIDQLEDNRTTTIYENLKSRYQWFQTHIVHSNLAENAKKTLNVYNQTKNMIGVMGATINNLRDFSLKAITDSKSKSSYTGQIVNEATEYLGWRDEMAGFQGKPTPYKPIFDFLGAYESETSRFRDPNGNFSITQGILSATSDQALMNHMGVYNKYLLEIKQKKGLINDMEIRDHLQKALLCEREARWLNLQVNMELYGRSGVNLVNSLKSLKKGFNKNLIEPANPVLDELMIGSKTGASAKSGSSMHSDAELLATVDKMNAKLAEAAFHRNAAIVKMEQLIYEQMNPANLDLLQIRRLQIAKNQAIKTYKNNNWSSGGTSNNTKKVVVNTNLAPTSKAAWETNR